MGPLTYDSVSTCLALPWHLLKIHDLWAFFLIFLLGLAQAAVAVYGAELAVLALPPQTRRRPHHNALWGLGVVLFCLTIAVGYVNDHNQAKAEVETSAARNQLGAMRTQAELGLQAVQQARVEIQQTRGDLASCSFTNEGVRRVGTLLDQAQRNLLNARAVQNQPVPIPAATTPPQVPHAQTSNHLSNVELQHALQSEVSKLQSEENSNRQAEHPIIRGMVDEAYRTNAWPIVPTDYQRQEMGRIYTEEYARYTKGYLPQVEQLRTETLSRLSLSPAEAKHDQDSFTASTSKLAVAPVAPTTFGDMSPTPRLSYAELRTYLDQLGQQLGKIPDR